MADTVGKIKLIRTRTEPAPHSIEETPYSLAHILRVIFRIVTRKSQKHRVLYKLHLFRTHPDIQAFCRQLTQTDAKTDKSIRGF